MTLQAVMSALIIDAKLHPGKAAAVTLAHGLRIMVRIDKDPNKAANAHMLTIGLGRKGDAAPSPTEWTTVLNALNPSYLPADLPAVSGVESNGWQYVYAHWPVNRAVLVTVR